eukprot:TRINITY_DN72348_c0_g1_i1.p1 TRINITY_DN72348_c0_g1~~TRINITY_DN72348_c0_g1_i1.p1  ORF type:complete len:451 (-),score=90.10 TRINITY_DN72348_c0_g1_i1:8-1360(-)
MPVSGPSRKRSRSDAPAVSQRVPSADGEPLNKKRIAGASSAEQISTKVKHSGAPKATGKSPVSAPARRRAGGIASQVETEAAPAPASHSSRKESSTPPATAPQTAHADVDLQGAEAGPAAGPIPDQAVTAAPSGAAGVLAATADIAAAAADPMGEFLLRGAVAPKTETNRQRVLVFAARGITALERHLLMDLRVLLPHSRAEGKLDTKRHFGDVLPEIMDLRGCTGAVLLEVRRREHCYMWLSRRAGPSAKFQVHNIHTMREMKLPGNGIKGSRPLLHFDQAFSTLPHLQILQRLFVLTFGTPRGAPKTRPFVDRVMAFYYVDGKIFVRHYQISEEAPKKQAPADAAAIAAGIEVTDKRAELSLVEIGPRFALTPIKIFSGVNGGPLLWHNERYQTPTAQRIARKRELAATSSARRGERAVPLGKLRVPEIHEDADLFREAAAAEKSSAE